MKKTTRAASGRTSKAANTRTTRVSNKDVSRVMSRASKREGTYFRVTEGQRRAAR